MARVITSVAVTWSLVEALAVVSTARGLDMTFGQSLIVAVVSGTLGAIGVVAGAWIAAHAVKPTRDRIEDVAGKVGANRRETDPPPNGRE